MISVETSDDLDGAKINNVYTILNQLNAIRVGDTKQVLSFIRMSNQISNRNWVKTVCQIICSEGQDVRMTGFNRTSLVT